ncbi:MAG: hypothetical protein HQK92_03400 [Nitrospirae bacterium]|nr:hypothetical protein [Nitrospirota bacterium]
MTEKNMKDSRPLSYSGYFIGKLSVYAVAVCLFFINLAGYTAFRYFISDDLFGGDTANVSIDRMSSYTLTRNNFVVSPSLFCALILSGKNVNPDNSTNAFIYNLLSPKGRDATERLAKNPDNERDKEIFLYEFNTSVLDKNIEWPVKWLRESLTEKNLTQAGKHYYNLQVLSLLYPKYIKDNLTTLFRWKNDPPTLIKLLHTSSLLYFTIDEPTRYSPITNIYSVMVQSYLQNSPDRIIYAIVLMGFFYTTLMLMFFLLSFKLINSIPWSLFAVFLFQSSVATIAISYQLFCLPYLFVPLVMVSAIYAYLQYKDSARLIWLILFFSLSLIAPWLREFPGAIPFIVFASEALSYKGRRSLVILILCVPLMLHSIYPSLLPWFIGLNKGGVYNVLDQGNVQQITSHGFLNWHFGALLFIQFPPVLWLAVVASVRYWLQMEFLAVSNTQSNQTLRSIFRNLAILLLITASIGFLYSFYIANMNLTHYALTEYGPFLIALVFFITLASFRFNKILPIYFLLSFVPFLRIAMAELHLSFVLVPISIMFTLWFKYIFTSLANCRKNKKVRNVSAILAGLLVIGLADQAMNIPSTILTTRHIAKTNKEMGLWLKKNTPRHSIVVMNFYNFTDVFYYSNYHFDPYETVENCPMGPDVVVHKNKDFKNLLNNNLGIRDVYLLAAEHEFKYKPAELYHSHKYVTHPPGAIEKLNEFSAKTIYYYLDPIKYFTPPYFISFLGYMDWSTDFYYNNTQSLFKRIVQSDYKLYKLKDMSKGFLPEEELKIDGESNMLKAVGEYKGFNILNYLGKLYGVPQSMGPINFNSENDRTRKGIVTGKELDEIKMLIDKEILNIEQNTHPKLVGDYHTYNIVKYRGQFWAIPQSMGYLDLSKEYIRNLKGILVGKNRREIETLIDNYTLIFSENEPQRLVGDYNNYKILKYKGHFWGIPQSMGAVDLSKEKNTRNGVFTTKELYEIERLIDNDTLSIKKYVKPRLVGDYKKYNIVIYKGHFWGIPQSKGAMDLTNDADISSEGIVISKDRNEIENIIDKEINTNKSH